MNAGAIGRGPRRDFGRDDRAVARAPENAVLDFRPGGALDDVERRQAQENRYDESRRRRTEPQKGLAGPVHAYRLYPAQLANGIPRISGASRYPSLLFSTTYNTNGAQE